MADRSPRSLQSRLLLAVLGLVLLAWTAAAALTWHNAQDEVGDLLDAHLAQTAALLRLQQLDELNEDQLNEAPDLDKHQHHVVFQLWREGQLLARSKNAPTEPLTHQRGRGFADSQAAGKSWRVFVTQGHEGDVNILVGEQQSARQDIVRASVVGMLKPMALALPLLALGIWWVVRGLVRPLRQLGAAVSVRQPQSLVPLPSAGVPPEVLPLVSALNDLFTRMAELLVTERQFTADAAHELRTPISNLMMQTQVVLSRPRDADSYRDILESNAEEYERLARMVSDMLFLAKAENGLAIVYREPVDLAREVHDLFDFYEALADERTIRLEMQGEGVVQGDRLMLRRALNNLLSNALRHTPAGGHVAVTIVRQEGLLVLTVENTGEMIPAQHLARLFERFYRADPSRQHASGEGTGLGLAITQAILRAHKGDVRVTSQPGSTSFGLRFPF